MIVRLSILLFLFLAWLPSGVRADAIDPCEAALAAARIAQAAIKDLPELKAYLSEFLLDPNLSPQLRNKLTRALSQPDLTVSELTGELVRLRAVASLDPGDLVIEKFPIALETVNEKAEALGIEAPYGSILLASGDLRTQLLDLVHEAAHVRFQAFLNKNKEHLAQIYSDPEMIAKVKAWSRLPPPWVIRGLPRELPDAEMDKPLMYMKEGKLVIARHFYDYLQELYALDAEFQMESTAQFQKDFGAPSISDRRLHGINTLKGYNLRDPRVVGLAKVPLQKLLTGNFDSPPATAP